MKYRLVLTTLLSAIVLNTVVAQSTDSIVRDGWTYDRFDFHRSPAELEALRLKNRGLETAGWAEYDFEVEQSGWYELWLGRCPAEWPRDVFIDGETISRLGISYGSDKLESAPRNGVQFKEVNVYLEEGSHQIRFQRYGFPGVLPSIWELRPAAGDAGSRVRVWFDGARIVNSGDPIDIRIQAGTDQATVYELFWKNEVTDELTSAGAVEFAANQAFSEKEVTLIMPDEGYYSLQAQVDGEWLRPSDLKAGFFLSGDLAVESAPLAPEFSVSGVFSSGAVLQQGKPMPVWGRGFPGEEVTVTLAGEQQTTTVDDEGFWEVLFGPLEISDAPVELLAESGNHKEIHYKDLVVGDVWLLSGQSNMGGSVISAGGEQLLEEANRPNVRLAYVFDRGFDESGKPWVKRLFWSKAVSGGDANKLRKWNSIPFAFGMEVEKVLDYPIGLINANRGGTYISTWISREAHATEPSLQVLLDVEQEETEQRVPEKIHLNKLYGKIVKWKRETEKAKESGKELPKAPTMVSSTQLRNGIGLNYDNLIKPFGRFPIKGVLWYQGESDSSMAAAYSERFKVLVEDWRNLFGDETLPFLYVQVAYGTGELYTGEPVENTGSELKGEQFLSLSEVPYTAMVVTDDLMVPSDDVHYKNKLPVGQRLAWAALSTVYDVGDTKLSPIYRSLEIQDGSIRLYFDYTAGGLRASNGEPLGGFTIAGEDRVWREADAVADGETIVVSSPEVPNPVAVRYSWAPQPSGGNLVNAQGLPSPVFRTDDWELTSEGVYWVQKN
ncbi:MAG: sialate O-acetylesterase [Puniceicoccales bacterium]